MYGGKKLITVFSYFFQSMTKFSYVPIDLKRGIITTMFKGGTKDKKNPNSYRAISLCSTILKLYEKTLLYFTDKGDSNKICVNQMQGGFQKNMNCLMTTFMLRESVYFARENNSKLYACFLDTQQCFDRVSHTILLVKLFHTGINLNIFKVILNMFENVYSCVKSDGHTSAWFPVQQGTRQGQVLSPRLYLVYINDLMNKLQQIIHVQHQPTTWLLFH